MYKCNYRLVLVGVVVVIVVALVVLLMWGSIRAVLAIVEDTTRFFFTVLFQALEDISWDWWWSWDVGTLWLVTVLISSVRDRELLAIGGDELVTALGSGGISILQVSLFLGRCTIIGLIGVFVSLFTVVFAVVAEDTRIVVGVVLLVIVILVSLVVVVVVSMGWAVLAWWFASNQSHKACEDDKL